MKSVICILILLLKFYLLVAENTESEEQEAATTTTVKSEDNEGSFRYLKQVLFDTFCYCLYLYSRWICKMLRRSWMRPCQ